MPSYRTTPCFSTTSRGFSLVELMVVLAILAIVVAVAVPSYNDSTAASRESSALNQVLGTLQLARSEAAAGGEALEAPISVCGSTDQSSCDNDWSSGGIVRDNTGKVLRSIPAFKDVTVTGNAIVFTRSGKLKSGSNHTIAVQTGDRPAKTISVNAIGFAKID